jgi:flagellar basal-body rod modification protein FlgD
MDSISSTTTSADFYSKYGVNSTAKSTTAVTTSAAKKVEDTFMELLLAELRHQNPMEPMDSAQMVTQMAQMNSLQELQKITASLQNVNQSNNFLTASSLIGKKISYLSGDFVRQGLVSAFGIDNNIIRLLVDDQAITLADVIAVANNDEAANE